MDRGFIRPSVSPWGAPILFVRKNDGSLRIYIHITVSWTRLPSRIKYPLEFFDLEELQGRLSKDTHSIKEIPSNQPIESLAFPNLSKSDEVSMSN